MERSPQSAFKNALISIPVPDKLLQGVQVLRVSASGSTRKAVLRLSHDKFTLHMSFQPKRASSKGLFRSRSTDTQSEEESIDIGVIERIQRGQATRKFELATQAATQETESTRLEPERSFSFIFPGERSIDLMAHEASERNEILNALDRLIHAYQTAKQDVVREVLLLRYIWLDSTNRQTQTITATEIQKLMDRINFYIPKKELHANYEKFGKTIGLDRAARRKGLNFEQCCTFLHKIKRDSWYVKPVHVVWNELFGEFMNNGKPRKTVSDKTFLERFLHQHQGETQATLQQVQQIFRQLHQMEIANVSHEKPDPHRIDKDRFEAYLLGRNNDAFDPLKAQFDKRLMVHPISEYWINSSHNTYLTGDQFTSHSRVEMYSNALYRGCRCLELDIWDGERQDADATPVPVVWHGHTMTSKILFKDIIKNIKVFLNFHPDTFPIILSFENHCSIPYQEVMAEQLVEILGDSLYIPTEESLFGRLPAPWDLRGLIIIKGRRPDGLDADLDYNTDDDSEEEGQSETPSNYTEDTKASQQSTATQKHGVSPALARLTLFHGNKFKNWDASVRNPTHHMHSFTENKVRSLCRQSKGRKWAVYNQSHMTRTYPAGSRVDSSNYSPVLAWSTGCQLVALNFQTSDAALRLNDGRFRENGGCGYVLKPSSMMIRDEFSQALAPVRLSIRVLSGSCLPKPKGLREGDCIDPYVKVAVFDVKNEEKEVTTSYNTSVVNSNGFFPIWNNEKFSFTVDNWAVAMLQLTVFDKDVGTKDEFVASASIPISCLRQGLRSVKLFDDTNTCSGVFDFASLLIDVKLKRAVAEI